MNQIYKQKQNTRDVGSEDWANEAIFGGRGGLNVTSDLNGGLWR